jgi:proteasome assembly chaperone (PAC2) family protein
MEGAVPWSDRRRLAKVIDPTSTSADLPELTDPMVVVAFEGWNDAGDAATGAVEHLELTWNAKPLAALDPEDYYDFQVNRPTVSLIDGVSRRIDWPTTRISVARPPGSERDIVLIRGIEPNMRWRGFCAELIEILQELDVQIVVALGALLADTPHTRPTPVTGSAYDAESARTYGLEASSYQGPTGILGVFQDACVQAGLPAISFWAAVPHYVSQPPSPRATVALLQRVEEVLELTVPLGTLPQQADEWVKTVDEMANEDAEVVEYVRSLEERATEVDLSQANGDQIAREFERYLRRRNQS